MEQPSTQSQLQIKPEKSPSGFRILMKEIVRDRIALISLIFIVLVAAFVFGISLILDQDQIIRVELLAIFQPPSSEFWLGTDNAGRDVFGQLIIGTRNSLLIAIAVTALSGLVGLIFGLVAGYFGGHIDNILMRILDFFS